MGDHVNEDEGATPTTARLAAEVAGLDYAALSQFLSHLSEHLWTRKREAEADREHGLHALPTCVTRVAHRIGEAAQYAAEAERYQDQNRLPVDPWIALMVQIRTTPTS